MPAEATAALLWAPLAWLPDGWRENVLLRAGADGRWAEVTAAVAVAPPEARVLAGPLLPGVVDAHSHAFQRAFAGTSRATRERTRRLLVVARADVRGRAAHRPRSAARDRRAALRRAAARRLHAGVRVPLPAPRRRRQRLRRSARDVVGARRCRGRCRHRPDDPSRAVRARRRSTHALRDDQRRFRSDARAIFDAAARIRAAGRPLTSAGLAIHSLRAASAESIAALRALADGSSGPIHIHVAEQTGEVDECLRHDRHAADRMARAKGRARCALAARPRDARERRRDRRGRGERRRRRRLPEHRGQPRRRRARPARLARRRRAARRSAPTARRHATGARSCAARIRAAPARARAQRRRRAGARRRLDRRAALRAHARKAARPRRASLPGASSQVRAPMRWSSIRRDDALLGLPIRSARSTRSCSAARQRHGAT